MTFCSDSASDRSNFADGIGNGRNEIISVETEGGAGIVGL